mmetsp:Transcript_40837/g.108241  ORF Transcript_40837/g.108241 Transcript_40837/m.108241 type:complete len:103 (-) Transcript_40837:437-745(-)
MGLKTVWSVSEHAVHSQPRGGLTHHLLCSHHQSPALPPPPSLHPFPMQENAHGALELRWKRTSRGHERSIVRLVGSGGRMEELELEILPPRLALVPTNSISR